MASPSAGSDVDAARALLARILPAALNGSPSVLPTPLRRAASLSHSGRDVYLKIETGLPTGSFKIRGAIYSLSTYAARRPVGEVVAASTGNHGAAVAYAARLLEIPTTIFLPANPNPVKAARIAELGARIVESGADLSAAIDAAYDHCAREGAFFLHDAADPDIPSATGTIAAEIVEELPSVTAIYVPMGDTALVRGVASAAKRLKPDVRIVGVVAERAAAYALAWRSGEATETASADTIADGLAVRRPLAPNVAAIRALVDDVRTVSDEDMLRAIDWLMTHEHVMAEPAGAAATAAFLEEVRLKADTTDGWAAAAGASVLLVTGGNIAPDVIASVDALRRRGPAPRP